MGILPLPPRGSHEENLLPSNTLTLWSYTDMSDPRWTWGREYILLNQDPDAATPQKVGADVKDGWCAYVRDEYCMIKLFERIEGATYPDSGCTVEMFTNDFMLELETLGPLEPLSPGAHVRHTEDWFIFRDVATPTNDAEVAKYIGPLVRQAREANQRTLQGD